MTNSSGGTLTNDGFLTNAGTFSVENGSTLNNNFALGKFDEISYLTNNGTLTNDGYFVNGGTLNNNGTLTNDVNGWLQNNGNIQTEDGTFINNGTLAGSGYINGDYTDQGVTKAGNSAGVLTINGDFFKVDGSKEIELGGLFDGGGDKSLTEYDWLDVTGNVELAGTLDVSLIDGFDLQAGDAFNFLRVGGILTGQYDGLGEGDLVGTFSGRDLFITYGGGDGNDVGLFTRSVPEPGTILILSMLAGLRMTVRRRR